VEGRILRVFVAGATGALGRHLIPGLVAAGHQVTGTTTPGKVGQLREAGAEPVVVDGLDREAVIAAVRAARREVIVHQMIALADVRSLRKPDNVRGHERTADPGPPTTCWRARRGRAPAGSSRRATSPCTSLPAAW
jgi:nucleoside-diphosphate-sugar epimerase